MSLLYLCNVYMKGHVELIIHVDALTLFVRPTFLFMRHKETIAKINKISEKSQLGPVSKFCYYGNP